jgi:hypothetical protein
LGNQPCKAFPGSGRIDRDDRIGGITESVAHRCASKDYRRLGAGAGDVRGGRSAWHIKNYDPEVNLFVDHSQIVQLECLRAGIWGTTSLWGRVVTYKDESI